MTVLIVGGDGYIGSKLCEKLSSNSIAHISLDNLIYGKNVGFHKVDRSKNFIQSDIRDVDIKFFDKVEAVIFLAALSNNPITTKNKNIPYKVTEKYTMKIAKICKKKKIKFIYPSSCSIYGFQNANELVNEKSKPNPLTYYSKNKYNLEKKLIKISDKNFKPIIFRPATVFGYSNSMRFDLVINMLLGMAITKNKIILNSDGQAYRPFVDIETLCDCFIKALNISNKKYLIVNIGLNSFNLKIIDLAKIISKITKRKIYFLNQINDKNKDLFKDSLINNNRDERSYKVDFSLAKEIFNLKNKNLTSELKKFQNELKKIKNLKNLFINKNFYRLEKLHIQIKKNKVNPLTLKLI